MTRTNKILFAVAAVFFACGVVFFVPSANAESAEDNYKLYCVQCHGTLKSGGGINAASLSVQPRNHTSKKDMGALSDDNIFLAIKKGGLAVSKSSFMPPWEALLNDDEIKDMVKHLRAACQCTYAGPAK